MLALLRLVILVFSIVFFQINFALAENIFDNNSVAKDVEKSLLFDKQAKEQFDFYSQEAPLSKETIKSVIIGIKEKPENTKKNKKDKEKEKDGSSELDIAVTDKTKINYKLKEKEKFAYNAVLAGQYEIAIELYKSILAKDPKNNYAKYALATVYQKLGQYRQSKTLYQDLLKQEPENKQEIINNIINIMIEETPREASYLLGRLSQQNPDSAFICVNAALANEKIGNYNKAIEYYKKAVNIEPDNASYYYNLAILHDRTKQYLQAIDYYNLTVKNYNNDPAISIVEVQNRISNLKTLI